MTIIQHTNTGRELLPSAIGVIAHKSLGRHLSNTVKFDCCLHRILMTVVRTARDTRSCHLLPSPVIVMHLAISSSNLGMLRQRCIYKLWGVREIMGNGKDGECVRAKCMSNIWRAQAHVLLIEGCQVLMGSRVLPPHSKRVCYASRLSSDTQKRNTPNHMHILALTWIANLYRVYLPLRISETKRFDWLPQLQFSC